MERSVSSMARDSGEGGAPLRRVVEAELSRRLSEIAVDDNLLGSWLLTGGLVLLSFDLAGVFFFLRLYMLSMR